MNLSAYVQRYENELIDNVIPFWETHCVDQEYGGYFTSLDRDGSVYDTEKYMWMQWRIVYMFATFYMSPYRQERWLEIARQGFDFLTKHGKSGDGTYYFALNRQGTPTMAPSNIFSDCFARDGRRGNVQGDRRGTLQAGGGQRHAQLYPPDGQSERTLGKSDARQAEALSHGHFMILANLGSVMKDCLGTDEYDAETERAVNTVLGKFWNEEYHVLFENVNPDGTFDLDSCEGRFINPGHGLESMWFVMNYAERRKDQAMIRRAADIVKALLEFGTDREYGGIYYFMDVLGKPHLELQWDMKLWWPHNEATLATLFACRLTGDKYYWERFKEIDRWSWSHFKDPEYPEWFAYLNRRGEPTHMLKGGKWKTMFHLPRCLYTAVNQMKLMEAE